MRVFSAIQPSGLIHIGNYLGAIKQFIELQEKNECFFAIVDLHAITVPYKVSELQKNTLEAAVCYLASGIDPEKSTLFVQSQVKEHTELSWLLGTITPVGDLLRMTQYKDKSKMLKTKVGAGLLNYPILMAADILLYKAEVVPVGEDQKQHLEITRTIARQFNKRFGYIFPEPVARLSEKGSKIMALNDPTKKMSKSIPESCLFIFDEPEQIKRKVMSAVTDSGRQIRYDLKRKPGISNLLNIYSEFSGKTIKELEKKFKNSSYEKLKKSLAELLIKSLEPMRRKRKELLSRHIYIKEILERGKRKAVSIAETTMKEVLNKMGLSF